MKPRLTLSCLLLCAGVASFAVAQENCKVILPYPERQQIETPYQGECRNGLAHGKGTLGVVVRIPEGKGFKEYRNVFKGEFKEGMLDGRLVSENADGGRSEGEYRMNRPEGWHVSNGPTFRSKTEYRDGKPINGINWRKGNDGVETGLKLENGKTVAQCKTHGGHEVNCTPEMRRELGMSDAATGQTR